LSVSVSVNAFVAMDGATIVKEYDVISTVVKPERATPAGDDVGAVRSVEKHVVGPFASMMVSVHATCSFTRMMVEPLVRPVHFSCVAAVGCPMTIRDAGLPVNELPSADNDERILKLVVAKPGAAIVKMKVNPESGVENAEGVPPPFDVGVVKSEASALDAPAVLNTVIEHCTTSLTRTVEPPLACPTQDSREDAVGGPYTKKFELLPVILPADAARTAKTWNEAEANGGA